ncbi:MAG: hypothetical protein BWK80_35565 [Desulfobacteraceae bacterium IS3]|nr:MAG: hypothetical protein BWK80_35565 [Desulfobacteraceae bacterium IS3]
MYFFSFDILLHIKTINYDDTERFVPYRYSSHVLIYLCQSAMEMIHIMLSLSYQENILKLSQIKIGGQHAEK